MRKAFTLIELLVVIAIIAILAAILFPVFAQAKDAAKKTKSISNVKQVALANLLYSSDFDDIAPLAFTTEGSFEEWLCWSSSTDPYRKNWDMMYSPSGATKRITTDYATNVSSADTPDNWRFFVQYGYNASYLNLAPDCGALGVDNNAFGMPVSMTGMYDPASTLMVTETGQDGPEDNMGTNIVYPPAGFTATNMCTYGDWGPLTDLWYGQLGNTDKTKMGFFRARHAGGGVVAFCDGHAKSMKPGALARGTNWNANLQAGDIIITDINQFIWDLL